MYDFQKANMWKRISAAIFDFIILVIFILGFAWGLTAALNYDSYTAEFKAQHDRFETQFGVEFDITAEQYEALSAEEKAKFSEAENAFRQDPEVNNTYAMILNLTLIIITFSVLLGFLVLEFFVPLVFKNGQTLGKKIFGIGVMRADGVRLSAVVLFVRSILGKYTVGTMIPVLLCLMLYFNVMGAMAIVGIGILLIVQILLVIATHAHTPLHDKLASTVTVDIASQMIFDTPEELLAHKQKIHAEDAALKER